MKTSWPSLSPFGMITLSLDHWEIIWSFDHYCDSIIISSLRGNFSEYETLGVTLLQAIVSARIWRRISFCAAEILLYLKEASIGAINLGNDGLLVWEKFNPNSKTLFCWVVKLWEERLTIKLTGGCLLIFWDGFCFFNKVEIFLSKLHWWARLKLFKLI